MEGHDTCKHSHRLLQIEKVLNGNGKPGLIIEMATLMEKVNTMENNLESLATSYSALVKGQYAADVTEKLKIQLSEKRMRAFTIISIIFGISIPLTALIISIV